MKTWLNKIVAAIFVAALAVSGVASPASAASKNSITVADTQAGSVGIKQIASPWFNSGALSQSVMFRGLFRSNADLIIIKPDLASDYKTSKDGKTITITLKSGLKWSDGKAITADDVIWSMNTVLRVAQANGNYVNAFKQIVGAANVSASNTTNISGLTAKGNVITIVLIAPQGVFMPILAQFMILPKHSLANENPLTLATNNFWKDPVTSGAFKVGKLSPDNFITLVPNDQYEGAKPSITEMNIVSSANLVSDAKAGKIDYFTSGDSEVIRAMKSVTSFKSNSVAVAFYRYFIFNLTQEDGPFADVKAREALVYGVNWKALIKLLYPTGKVINSGVTSGMPFHLPSIPKYKYDPVKAKQLLTEAKFDFSKTVRLRHYYAGATEITFMTAIAQDLINLGIKTEMLKFQGDATTELFTNRNYDIALKGLSAFNVSDWYAEYSNPTTFEKIIGKQDAFAALNGKLSQAITLRDKRKVLTDLQKLEQADLLKLPLHSIQQFVFVSKRISGTSKFGNPLYVYDNNFANWVLSN